MRQGYKKEYYDLTLESRDRVEDKLDRLIDILEEVSCILLGVASGRKINERL
jgi:hypothetical protein